MKGKYILLFLLFTLIQFPAWSQIDDDMEIDTEEKSEEKSEEVIISNALVNKYRLGDGIGFSSLDRSYRMEISGYLQPSMIMQKYTDDRELYLRMRMRRVRMRLQGNALGDKLRYRLDVDLVSGSEIETADGSLLMDAWMQYRPYGSKFVLTVGQRATPTDNRELLTSSYALQLNERSRLSSIFGTVREVGVFAEGSYKVGIDSYLRPALAITDGTGPISATGTPRYGNLKYGGRLNYLPFGLFRLAGESRANDMAYELSPKLSLGVAYSYNVGVTDRRGRELSNLLYKNDQDKIVQPDFAKLVVDFLFKCRGWSFMGEFSKSWVHVPSGITQWVRNNGTISRNFEVNGVTNVPAFIKQKMIMGSAFNVQGGHLFRNFWSINARYTHVIPETYSFLNNQLYYARNNVYELGFTRFLTKSYAAKIQGTFGLVDSDGVVTKVNGVKSYNGFEANFNIMFQLVF